MFTGMADGQGLLPGAICANNDVLRFALDPEVFRVIRQICDESYERRPGGGARGFHPGVLAWLCAAPVSPGRRLSAISRLKCGITDSTRSAGCCAQCSRSSFTIGE